MTGSDRRSLLARYTECMCAAMEAISRDEADAVQAAAQLVAGQLRADGPVYVYGPGGHSALAVTMLLGGAFRSTAAERTSRSAADVVAESGVGRADPYIIVNAASVGAAETARGLGARVIALSSRSAATGVPSGRPARACEDDLSTLAEVHVDTHVPAGDAVLTAGPDFRVGGVSTALNSFALRAVLTSAVEHVVAAGGEVRVWRSSYAAGGDTHNAEIAERMPGRVPQL